MQNSNGNDILNTFNSLNVDLRHLSPNVIHGWFDTDCQDTKELLNWLCNSLSEANYVSPLEKSEYDNIEDKLESHKCAEELAGLNPEYLSMLDITRNAEEIALVADEADLLEEENKNLDELLKIYQNMDSKLSLDLTRKTQKEIDSKIEEKKSHEACVSLCQSLSQVNKRMHNRLFKYDPDSHLANFIDVGEYYENIENISSSVVALVNIEKSGLDSLSCDGFSDELETCRRRILHSHQRYLANKVEVEKLKEIHEFLKTINKNENEICADALASTNFESKELYKERMCSMLDGIASKLADHYLKQTRIHYVQQELQEFQQKSQNISNMLENLNKFLSFYTLTHCLLLEDKKDVECINNFYKKMVDYVNNDLHRCCARTEQMRTIISEYEIYLEKPAYERSSLISAIAKILSSEDHSLKSVANAVGKFKSELNSLERQLFHMDFIDEKEKSQIINENIRILEQFLMSGPTNNLVLIPIELQKAWFEIEEHRSKERASVMQAVEISQTAKKEMSSAHNYTMQLWLNFLANPSKIESILKQAEDDFKKKTDHYF